MSCSTNSPLTNLLSLGSRGAKLALWAMPLFLSPVCSNAAETPAPAAVTVHFRTRTPGSIAEQAMTVEGRIVTDFEERGILLLDRSGRLWPIDGRDLQKRSPADHPFRPYSADELTRQLQQEFPHSTIVTTKHYVLCSEAGREYARWAGLLFERLMGAFRTHWDRRPLHLKTPEFPLTALILRDRKRFMEYALADAGPSAVDALGYYSLLTNRVVMYDLTAEEAGNSGAALSPLELARRLAAQTGNVTTIVHEATHQIAFNCGLHTRMADNPLWLVEGMAMYFETPDLKNASGWRTVGQVNRLRLEHFREYATLRRRPGSLRNLVSEDASFQTADSALDAYSEAWTVTYFLIRTKRAAYVEYLVKLRGKPALERDDPETRLREFETAFGPVADLERAMLLYASRLRES